MNRIVMAPLSASFLNIFYTITGTSLAVISGNLYYMLYKYS